MGCLATFFFCVNGRRSRVSYQVIARKWRPQSFQQLVGQDHVSQTLLNALKSGRLPQVLLFTGPRGTGKTSSARILAKSLRCLNPASDHMPCNACRSCEEISAGVAVDVLEIDGASNNGVDEVRRLREGVGYMPSYGKQKVYIIDEVHMLSTSAFNALLKTTEEPPPHVTFIMATTEVQKIPNTILSRCQRFDFRRIPSRRIAEHLQAICRADGVSAEPEAIWLIARQADGSMRDGQSLLDQVITYSEKAVTLAKTIEVLGLTDRVVLLETLRALANRDAHAVVDVVEKLFKSGVDAKVFAQDLLEEIRNASLVRLVPDQPSRVADLPDSEIESLREITSVLSDEELQMLFDMALKGVNDLLRAQDPRIVLEMLLLRMSQAPRLTSLAQLLAAAESGVAPAPIPAARSRASAQPAAPPLERVTPLPPVAAVETAPPLAADVPETEPGTAASWPRFVARVKRSNALLGAMLENTHLLASEDGKIVIGVPKKMSFMFDKVKDAENIKRIETFIETFWHQTRSVEAKLADPGAAAAPTPKAIAEERRAVEKRSIESQIENDPLVRRAQSAFKAQIKSIKETR